MLERHDHQLRFKRRRGKLLDWEQLRIGTLQSRHQNTLIPTSLFSEITLIVCDQQGKVWIGADSMLFAWLIKEKKFVLFGESDGVIQNEYLSKPRLLSMQGDVYMGGVKGLLHINCKIPLTTSELPQLQLSDVIINGRIRE